MTKKPSMFQKESKSLKRSNYLLVVSILIITFIGYIAFSRGGPQLRGFAKKMASIIKKLGGGKVE